ncbi:hypothetical protein TNCV_718361 [Trichonephila clavipes]|nr:hypothetical protein TNCV_718361 [Trichonephila clavipes]
MRFANDYRFSAFRRRMMEKCHLKRCTKEKLCGGFLIRKALCEIGVCLEYHVMPRIIRRNTYHQVSEFNSSKIVAC